MRRSKASHAVRAKTLNVSAVSFELGAGAGLLDPGSKVTVNIDGQSLVVNGPDDGSFMDRAPAEDRRASGQWPKPRRRTGKRHNLQGPIDDAFMDSFLMVRPTGAPMNETVGKWAKSEEERAIQQWRRQFRGDAPVKDDAAVTDADIASSNLVLWGDPQSNKVLARIADSCR